MRSIDPFFSLPSLCLAIKRYYLSVMIYSIRNAAVVVANEGVSLPLPLPLCFDRAKRIRKETYNVYLKKTKPILRCLSLTLQRSTN